MNIFKRFFNFLNSFANVDFLDISEAFEDYANPGDRLTNTGQLDDQAPTIPGPKPAEGLEFIYQDEVCKRPEPVQHGANMHGTKPTETIQDVKSFYKTYSVKHISEDNINSTYFYWKTMFDFAEAYAEYVLKAHRSKP